MPDLELLASGYGLIEGPRVDADNNLYFSDVHNGGVYRRRPSGEIGTVIPKRRGVGGILFHADGGIVVGGRNIQHVKDGEVRVLLEPQGGGGFNDMHSDASGRIYVGTIRSDPFSANQERVPGECWRIDRPGEATQIYGDIGLSNGIGFSPNGTTVYHADTARSQIVAHDLAPDGSATNRRALVTLDRGAPDGLAVDGEGGLWAAAYGGSCVAHYTSAGELVEHIDVPARGVTSVCFGGRDMRALYVVTADNNNEALGGSIFRLRAPVAGMPTPLVTI